jgi:hypothetical protein
MFRDWLEGVHVPWLAGGCTCSVIGSRVYMFRDWLEGGSSLSLYINNNYIVVFYFIHHDKSSIFTSVFKTAPVQTGFCKSSYNVRIRDTAGGVWCSNEIGQSEPNDNGCKCLWILWPWVSVPYFNTMNVQFSEFPPLLSTQWKYILCDWLDHFSMKVYLM